MREMYVPRVAILASGSGSTAGAFIEATQDGRVDATVELVICDKDASKAGIYDRIDALNERFGLEIPTQYVPGQKQDGVRGQSDAESERIARMCDNKKIDHVALMGYMRIVRGLLLDKYGWHDDYSDIAQARMSNTHPAVLPETADTFGIHASEKVVELGLPRTAHTTHLVAAGVDAGPVLASTPVEIEAGQTAEDVFSNVQLVEKATLPLVLDRFLKRQMQYRRLEAIQNRTNLTDYQ